MTVILLPTAVCRRCGWETCGHFRPVAFMDRLGYTYCAHCHELGGQPGERTALDRCMLSSPTDRCDGCHELLQLDEVPRQRASAL